MNGNSIANTIGGSYLTIPSGGTGGLNITNVHKRLYLIKVTGTCQNVENSGSKRTCKIQIVRDQNKVLGEVTVSENSQFKIEGYFVNLGGVTTNLRVKNISGSFRHFSDVQYLLIKYMP